MKIAISSTGTGLDDKAHDLFGRCDYFVIVDLETGDTKAIKNEFAGAPTGAGTACAQVVFDEGVKVVISGKVGPKAYEVLNQGEIEIFLSPPGITVSEALTRYQEGSLRKMVITKY